MPSDTTAENPSSPDAAVTRTVFGRTLRGEVVHRLELRLPSGASAAVLTRGAALQQLRVPDRDGTLGDVVAGLADVAAYEADTGYLGAVVGRVANRIAGGRFTVDGTEHQVPVNDGAQALHGGVEGFDQRVWHAEEVGGGAGPAVRLRLVSPDGDMGFPGELLAEVVYTLSEDASGVHLELAYRAGTDAATPVSLTNHAYLNLDGPGTGTIEDHELVLAAGRYLPVDGGLIPTGELADVTGTPFDFRTPRRIGASLRDADPQLLLAGGYDHNWVLDDCGPGRPATAAVLTSARSGRTLTVTTDRPGVQFYSGNFLTGSARTPQGRPVRQGDALCLETQALPDAVNRPAFRAEEFGDVVLRPGQVWETRTVLTLSAG